MSKSLSLTNLVDIEADSIMIGDEDIYDIFLTKTSGSDIVGISHSVPGVHSIRNSVKFLPVIIDKIKFYIKQIK